MIALVL